MTHPRQPAWAARLLTIPSFALVHRELVRSLRSVRPLLAVAALVVVCIFAVLLNWPHADSYMQLVRARSQDIVLAMSFILLIAVALVVPAYASSGLVSEREERTYDLLFLTLIRPSGVVVGKFLNALGFYFILVTVTTPFLATLFFLIGYDWLTFVAILSVISATALSCAALATLCSALARHTATAVVGGFASAGCVLGAPLIPAIVLCEIMNWRGGARSIERIAELVCPFVTLAEAYSGRVALSQLLFCVTSHLVLAAIALFAACLIVRHPREPAVPESDGRSGGWRRPFRRLLFGIRRRYPPIRDWRNPIFIRELRYGARTRKAIILRLCIALMLLSLSFAFLLNQQLVETHRSESGGAIVFYAVLQMALIGLLCPGICANSLTAERENMDMLRMTLLDTRHLVFGKARAGCRAALMLWAAGLPGWIIMTPSANVKHGFAMFVMALGSTAVCALLAVRLSMVSSAVARRTPTAIVASYLLSAGVFFGPFALAMITYELLHQSLRRSRLDSMLRGMREGIELVSSCLSPMIAYLYGSFELLNRHGPVYLLYWLVSIIYALMLGVFALRLAVRIVERRNRRDA
ncbi:MAG: hypothetical protein JXR94_19080 [Candidatus Hydrogenedentes bacterium]|nr:hypothetical protein [Candidatus Hydrogenedentota bacterium]